MLFKMTSILKPYVVLNLYSSGDLGNGLMLSLMTNFQQSMVNLFLFFQKHLMSFGLHYWRKLMPSRYQYVVVK